jgi:hypothetical protein
LCQPHSEHTPTPLLARANWLVGMQRLYLYSRSSTLSHAGLQSGADLEMTLHRGEFERRTKSKEKAPGDAKQVAKSARAKTVNTTALLLGDDDDVGDVVVDGGGDDYEYDDGGGAAVGGRNGGDRDEHRRAGSQRHGGGAAADEVSDDDYSDDFDDHDSGSEAPAHSHHAAHRLAHSPQDRD